MNEVALEEFISFLDDVYIPDEDDIAEEGIKSFVKTKAAKFSEVVKNIISKIQQAFNSAVVAFKGREDFYAPSEMVQITKEIYAKCAKKLNLWLSVLKDYNAHLEIEENYRSDIINNPKYDKLFKEDTPSVYTGASTVKVIAKQAIKPVIGAMECIHAINKSINARVFEIEKAEAEGNLTPELKENKNKIIKVLRQYQEICNFQIKTFNALYRFKNIGKKDAS